MTKRRRSVRLPAAILLMWLMAVAAATAVGQSSQSMQGTTADAALDAAVRQYFSTQEAKDADGYLALWSPANQPRRAMLQYIFDSGDDRYSDVRIEKVATAGPETRVRVSATRDRTSRSPAGVSATARSHFLVSLAFTRENGMWKLLREAPPADDLAAALVEAGTTEERDRLLQGEPGLVDKALVDALARRGTGLVQQQQYARAQSVYELVLDLARRVGDLAAAGEALQNLGNAAYFQRNLARALEMYQQRLVIERARGSDEAIAAALMGVATIRYSYAEYDGALQAYREALAIQELLPDRAVSAATRVSTGNVLFLLGDYAAAIADYTRSRDVCHELGDARGEADALAGLGRVYTAQGDYASALTAFAGVLDEGRARANRSQQGGALLSIGDVQFRLSNLDAARKALDESRAQFAAVPDPANAGRARQGLGLVELVSGRFDTAEQQYQQSIKACTSADDRECAAAGRAGLGFAQFAQDKFGDAVVSYQAAIADFKALNRDEPAARARVGLSQAYTGLEKLDEALDAAREARMAAVGLGLDDVLWRALIAEARAYSRMGSNERAMASARAAILAVDQLREDARLRPGSPLPRDTVNAFATLARLQAVAGDGAAAFETTERMRAHDLRAALVSSERDITRGMTADEKEEERSGAQTIAALRAQVARARGLPKPDSSRLDAFERKLSAAVDVRSAQQDRLYARLPALRSWRGLVEPAAAADLASVLLPATVLLDLVVDDDGIVALAAWNDEGTVRTASRVTPMTRRELASRLAQMLQPEVLKSQEAWDKAASFLVEALPADVPARLSSATRVLVVPHGLLWRVPFAALKVGEKRLGAVPVVCIPSVTELVRTGAPVESAGPLLAVGAPEIAPAIATRISQTAPGWELRSADRVNAEIEAATRTDPPDAVELLVGAAATESAFRQKAGGAGVLLMDAPFRVNAASPLFSPVLLTGEPQNGAAAGDHPASTGDGSLELREAFDLDLHARVTVLSDPSALSMRDAAEEAGIVQWAWQAAGVPAVVFSRWSADDGARAAWLRVFHQEVRAGKTLDQAVANAASAVRQTRGWSAPFYWAGWLVVGR